MFAVLLLQGHKFFSSIKMNEVYEVQVQHELARWQMQMQRSPSVFNMLSKKLQVKINSYIPEKVHKAITATIKQMIKGVLFGAKYTVKKSVPFHSLQEREIAVLQLIQTYKHTAAAEGGITGAGGILLGFAEFPILIGIKLKMLFDIAALYGFDVKNYKERVYILHIFELAFSSQQHRRNIFLRIKNWDVQTQNMPDDINAFEWRNLQQEYRDYIDLAKMAQLIPGIGAAVGLVVNYQLLKKLGTTAMNAYRLRLFTKLSIQSAI